MLITRYAKIVMAGCLAVFCLLVVFGNLTDYATNYLYVKRVLSMDTILPGNRLMYRAITHEGLWHFAYWLIILGQAVAGVLLSFGTIRLWRVRNASGATFNGAKGLVVAGALAAFIVWFFMFMVVGGEWFAMWQSPTWNGQEAAFRLYVAVLAVLIFVNQTDGDLPAPASESLKAKTSPAKKRSPRGPKKPTRHRTGDT